MAWAGMRGLLGPSMKLIGIVHDDPDVTAAANIRYDAAVTVNRPVEPEGEFGVMELAGGKYAVVTHKGPYEELSGAYQRVYGGWLPQSGHQLRDAPAFEQYLNSPQGLASAHTWLPANAPLRSPLCNWLQPYGNPIGAATVRERICRPSGEIPKTLRAGPAATVPAWETS